MKTLRIYLLLITTISSFALEAQSISGSVYEIDKQNKKIAIPGANIYWNNTTIGTSADQKGNFSIKAPENYPAHLIISFIGYNSDTIEFKSYKKTISVELKNNIELKEFEVSERGASSFINTIDPHYVETLSSKELTKAACCNISESFETNASVDVNFSDAISGTKKIQMLGLDGVYTQIQSENLPLIRGLSSAYGLTFIPGTWAESIQIKKGAGSVVNGYESITGQINLEMLKPDEAEKFYLNLYGNINGRAEANIHAAQKLSNKWSTMTFFHASNQNMEWDKNNDSFLDSPIKTQYNIFNRWKYRGKKHVSQFGIKGVYDELSAGQITSSNITNPYKIGITTKQVELFTKNGILFPETPHKSIGIINSLKLHEHNSFYGSKIYNARQISGYLNIIYQTNLGNEKHKIKFGGSWLYDNFDKEYNESFKFGKIENVQGGFTEYSFNDKKKTSLVVGLRGDYHNTFGFFATPRLHYKYNFTPLSAFRLSVGRGFRTANPFIENAAVMASSRTVNMDYDLKPEIAWNYGTSITHQLELFEKEINLSFDYYFTDFDNQVVVDIENPNEISFYNLDGKSYSSSLQTEVSVKLTHQLELKAAYKWYDIKTQYKDGLKEKPLVAKNRVLLNLAYFTNFDKWKIDLTGHWYGLSRLPSTDSNPIEYQIATSSNSYWVFNGQITRAFKKWELYSGVENILNFKQDSPIIASDNPNGPNFDASLIWGPVMGRNIYLGLRYRI